jgi:hypothetical protein
VDNDTGPRIDSIMSRLQARIAELGNIPGAQIGQQIFGSVQGGAEATLGVLDQLTVALNEMRAAGRTMSADPAQFGPEIAGMRDMIAITNEVIVKLKQLMSVQAEQQAAAAKSTAGYWPLTQEQRQAVAPVPLTSAAAERRIAAEEEAANAAIIASRQPGPTTIAGIAVPGTGSVPAFGLTGGAGLAATMEQIAATTGVGEGSSVTEAAARVVKAQSDLAIAINKEFLTVEQRTSALAGGIANIVAADRKLVAAEEAAAAQAEAATRVPVNLKEVTAAAANGQSAKIQQLELDLAINVAKQKQLAADNEAAIAAGRGAVSEVALTQQRIKTLAVEERLTAAMEQQAAGTGGGFGGGMGGLQMLKYYAFYQVFQEGSKLLGEVKKATEEYSLAVNQLSIALGGNQERAQTLAATYSTMGQNLATAPTIAVDAATKYTRFFQDTSGVSGDVGARLGSTVNLLEGAKVSGAFGDPAARAIANDKTLGELAAIARNYELGAQGASNLYDAATVIAQKYGLGESQGGKLTSGAAQIADLFKQSGFTAEQGLALTGSVMQYTGNTSEMAAGDLKRFLGRQGSDTFKNIFAEFSIDQNQTLRGELVDLGAKFKTLSETQRASIVSTLGGGRAGAAVVAAITDLPSQTAVAAKGADSVGIAFEQAQLRLGTFAGKLEQISADWSALAKDLGTSGLGLIFGDALALVDPLLRGVDALVNAFALLPGYVKQFLEVLALASVAGRVFGGSFGLEGITGMLTKVGGIGAGAAGAAEVVSAEATAARVAALGLDATAAGVDTAAVDLNTVAVGENAVAQGAAATAAGAGTASLVARLGALAGAAVGAAVAIAPFVEVIAGIAAIGEVAKVAGQSKDAHQLAADAITGHTNAKTLDDHAAAAGLADQAIAELQASHTGMGALVFGGTSLDGPSEYDKLLQRLQVQRDADSRASLTPAQQTEQDLRNFQATHTGGQGLSSLAPGVQVTAAQLNPTQQNFAADYTDIPRGINHLATVHASVASSMAQLRDELAHIPDSSLTDLLTPQSGAKGVGDELKRLTTQIGHSNNPIQNEADLGQISSYAAELTKRANASGDADNIDAAAAYYDTALKAYHQSILGNVKARVDSIHAMQSNNASSQAQIRGTVTQALTEFARTGDVNSVVALLAGVDKAFITSFNANISAERRVLADQALALEMAAGAAANAAIAATDDPRRQSIIANRNITAVTPAEKAIQDKIARDVKIASTMATASGLTVPGGSDFTWPKDKAAAASGPTAAQIEEARLAAQAIPGDPMSAAITNLRVAQYKMSEPKNQVEYWTALKALHDAQYAYSIAQQSAANDATQLREDLTNPLVVAREKVAEAQRQLAFDTARGALPDVTNKDRLALKQAQSAAEKTAFDQKFSDESTNYNLQRISLSAYLSYLNAQHNYLTAVHSKTRQQVDELNQVDQALKGLADSLQGQFNLGQIKVPTAYEARAIAAGGLTTNVQITINGTDIPAVKAILTQYLGQGVMSTAGSSARRV